jgi:protein TonB
MAWSAEAWSPPETEPEHTLDAAEPPEPEVRPVAPDLDSPWPAPAEPELAEPADPLAALRNLPLESLVLSPPARPTPPVPVATEIAPTELAQAAPPAPSGVPAATGNFRPPSLASTPGLAYPRDAHRLGQQGSALLRIHIAADGRVLDVELIESSGHERLDRAALTAVRTWSFHPATRDGVRVADSLLHRVTFRIEEG